MNSSNYQYAYFLGIGGIGMSALARYFHARGLQVAGYDKTPSEVTDALLSEGMQVHFDETLDALPEFVLKHTENTLLVYTPAIPEGHLQFEFLKSRNFPLYKRSEVLGMISRDGYCIAVAGTHGKTTTSTLIAQLLDACGINFSAFLGGISANFNSNYIHKSEGRDLFPGKPIVVLEADEFDRSFHRLNPDIAVITAIDPDHLDIYASAEAFTEAFITFAGNIKPGGTLLLQDNLTQIGPESLQVLRYGAGQKQANPEFRASFTGISNGNFFFDYTSKYRGRTRTVEAMHCGLPGYHNIENATAAIAIALDILNLNEADVRRGLSEFRGVKRRFEYLVKQNQHIVIDDYAHHPEELRAILSSVRALYPERRLTAVFQPHLYTRTRDFAAGFAEVLALPDELILMDIYPARELPLPGITSGWLLEQVAHPDKKIMQPQEILEYVQKQKPGLLLLLGAGDIDRLAKPVKSIYEAV